MILIHWNIFTPFLKIPSDLNTKPYEPYLSGTENMSDPIEIAMKKFQNHSSFLAIKQYIKIDH